MKFRLLPDDHAAERAGGIGEVGTGMGDACNDRGPPELIERAGKIVVELAKRYNREQTRMNANVKE
jgi:hypothetical protein